jgi:RNA polymerase sigma-70 factor, ECF subfamily
MSTVSQEDVLRAALKYQEPLTCYAYGILRDWALADDAVQESFIVAQTKWQDFEAGSSIYAWVRQILRYKCLDLLRARKREVVLEDTELTKLVDETLEKHATEEEADQMAERKSALRFCMEKINAESRQLILQCYRDTESYVSVADDADSTVNAIRVRVHRIRQALRRCIEKRLALEI